MNRSNNPAGTSPGRTRRQALGLLGAGAALLGTGAATRSALAQGDEVLTEALVLRDPDIPSTGNPDGDVNIVEWFDLFIWNSLMPAFPVYVHDGDMLRASI